MAAHQTLMNFNHPLQSYYTSTMLAQQMDHLSHSLSCPSSRVSAYAASNTVSFSLALLTLVPVSVYHVRINFS